LWVLEAARDKTKETIVGKKVAYYIYKHFWSVSEHIWSQWEHFEVFCRGSVTYNATKRAENWFCVPEATRDKTKETIVGTKVAYYIYKHFMSVSDHIWSQ
jgi:hypothetical protein